MTKNCDNCSKTLGPRRKRFCSNRCKDKWHNSHDPRKQAYGTYLNRKSAGLDSPEVLEGWKDGILSGDDHRINEATIEMEEHPF